MTPAWVTRGGTALWSTAEYIGGFKKVGGPGTGQWRGRHQAGAGQI